MRYPFIVSILLASALIAQDNNLKMPEISLIGDLSWVGRSIDDERYSDLSIPGLTHAHHADDGHHHATINAKRGLNLNYAELMLSSAVDPYVELQAVLHLSEEGVEIEELVATTTSLPWNLQARAGKFYSRFGRLNAKHHHVWNFSNQPLVYEAFFGPHNLLEKGVGVEWVSPLPFYLAIGGELLRGENENSFGEAGFQPASAGENFHQKVEPSSQPGLTTLYLKGSEEFGDLTLLAGASWARGSARLNHLREAKPHAFAGTTTLMGVDLTLRYDFAPHRYLQFQSEWMTRTMEGMKYVPTENNNSWDMTKTSAITKDQAGWYGEVVWGLSKEWRVGARLDGITKNVARKPDDLYQYNLMAEYNPSEFSRFRLQFTRDEARVDDAENRVSSNTLILQWNLSIGAHGAHPF